MAKARRTRVQANYRIPVEMKDWLAETAEENEISENKLVTTLLEFAIEDFEANRMSIGFVVGEE